MSPDQMGAVAASPRTERAMSRVRRLTYAVLVVLAVGAVLSAAANIYFLSQLKEQGDHIEELSARSVDQNDQLQAIADANAADRAQRAERLGEALGKVQEQFIVNDEANAARLEQLRAELLAAIAALDCSPGTPAPEPPPLMRRAALPPGPAPPTPVQSEPSPPVIVEVERKCTLNVLGVCVDLP